MGIRSQQQGWGRVKCLQNAARGTARARARARVGYGMDTDTGRAWTRATGRDNGREGIMGGQG